MVFFVLYLKKYAKVKMTYRIYYNTILDVV